MKSTSGIFCNLCLKEIEQNPYGYTDDHLYIQKRWGYGSEFDNEVHEIIMCQTCYLEFFHKIFKIKKEN